MSELLTDRAVEVLELVPALARLAVLVFIGWAIAQHLPWYDATGIVLAFWYALRPRGVGAQP